MILAVALLAAAVGTPQLEQARDRQDKVSLERAASELAAAAASSKSGGTAHYQAALAYSYLSEVALEQRDKERARQAAETGIQLAERAVSLNPRSSEHHRILGTLCGQVIPANVMTGLRYGRCAQDEIRKAIELDAGSAIAYVSRGVGNYYLPAMLGGGTEAAVRDFRKAIELNPKLAEAHLWLGIALRKSNKNAEARNALTKCLELNPHRIWAKQQLEKTPK